MMASRKRKSDQYWYTACCWCEDCREWGSPPVIVYCATVWIDSGEPINVQLGGPEGICFDYARRFPGFWQAIAEASS